jgi:hypothetical protein
MHLLTASVIGGQGFTGPHHHVTGQAIARVTRS